MFGIQLGSRRRKAGWVGLPVVLIAFLCIWGYEGICRERQVGEEWQGTLVRAYDGTSYSRNLKRPRYWDVRTDDGTIRSVRIYSNGLRYSGHEGDTVVKHAGQLDPVHVRRR